MAKMHRLSLKYDDSDLREEEPCVKCSTSTTGQMHVVTDLVVDNPLPQPRPVCLKCAIEVLTAVGKATL